MQRKRESGIDLLRCLAAFLVVAFHGNLYVGYQSEPQTGTGMWAANCFYHLTVACNGIFLMISGYLHSGKSWNRNYYKGLFGVVLGYILASVVSIPVRHFLLGQEKSLTQWVRAFFGFSGVYYGWFVEMYLGLMLISPLVNAGLRSMNGRQAVGMCCCLVAVTALPMTDYWAACYPLTYYAMGAAVRKTAPKLKNWKCLLGALVLVCIFGTVTLLNASGGAMKDGHSETFGSLGTMALVVLLFLGLYRVEPGKRTALWLRRAGEGAFGGYMLSHLLDAWVYSLVPSWHRPERYGLVVLFVTVPVFVISIRMGRLLHSFTEKIKTVVW